MKLNSHLLGIAVGVAVVVGWMWSADKEIEVYKGWTIFKSKGKFMVEKFKGTKKENPAFDTIEAARTWITTKEALAAVLPWGR